MSSQPAMRRWAAFLAAILLWMLATLGFARQPDILVERAWLEDPGGLLTWEDVRSRQLKPLHGLLSLGYSDAPVWIRLRIHPPSQLSGTSDSLFIRIRPMYLDEVVLFDPLHQAPERIPVGDNYQVSRQAIPATAFLYEVAPGGEPRDLWLRIQTSSTRIVHAEVLTASEVHRANSARDHLGGIYVGLHVIFILWGIVNCAMRPAPILAAFLCCQVISMLLGLSQLGYTYLYLSDIWAPATIDRITSTAVVLVMPSNLLLAICLLQDIGAVRWHRRLLVASTFVYPALVIGIWTGGHVSQLLTVNAVLALLTPIILVGVALMANPQPRQPAPSSPLTKKMIVAYFAAMLGFALFTIAPALGLSTAVEFSLYAVLWHGLSSGVLVLVMLQYKMSREARQRDQFEVVAAAAKNRAEHERVHREDRERLLQMLGHELRTPLATMRMALADSRVPKDTSSRLRGGVTEIAALLDRVVQAGRMEAGQMTLFPECANLLQLLARVCADLKDGGRIRPTAHPSVQDIIVCTDLTLLINILRNLLENALKYGADGGAVEVVVAPRDANGCWSVVVANAPGRAGEPDASRLFEKYYRSPHAGYCSGSGLGLYLCRSMARALGGDVYYEPSAQEIRFRLVLRDLQEGGE